jgi:hypothetical protein
MTIDLLEPVAEEPTLVSLPPHLERLREHVREFAHTVVTSSA